MEEENIITVRNRNLQKADEAFADFMFMLESYLNEKQLLFRVRIAIVRVRNWKM